MARGSDRYPLLVESIESSPAGKDRIVVRLEGRWQGRKRAGAGRALLVVEADGHRHRFPALLQPQPASTDRHGSWSASFALPVALQDRVGAGAVLWVDDVAMPLPADMALNGQDTVRSDEPAAAPEALPQPELHGLPGTAREHDLPPTEALRSELAARAAAEARLRGEVAELKAQLEARAAAQQRLERTHSTLRDELADLRAAVERSAGAAEERDLLLDELTRLRAQVEVSQASREAALREAEGLRGELDRLAGDLAALRAEAGVEDSAVQEAEALLAEARELRSRMVSGAPPPSPIAGA